MIAATPRTRAPAFCALCPDGDQRPAYRVESGRSLCLGHAKLFAEIVAGERPSGKRARCTHCRKQIATNEKPHLSGHCQACRNRQRSRLRGRRTLKSKQPQHRVPICQICGVILDPGPNPKGAGRKYCELHLSKAGRDSRKKREDTRIAVQGRRVKTGG